MSILGYANAKVKAWKSYLFDKDFFEKLMAAKNLDDVTAVLSKTVYQKDIEKGLVKYKGVLGIEEGLRLNLTRILQKLRKITKGDKKVKYLVELILIKWDIFNLKTILRGLHAKAETEEILEQLIPVGTIDEVVLQDLVKQPSLKSVIGQALVFYPHYAAPLRQGYEDYKNSNNLANLELELDKYYFAYVLKRSNMRAENAKILNKAIRREIDFTNIMILLRLTEETLPEDFDKSSFFIEGGHITSHKLLMQLINIDNIKDIIEALQRTPYYESLKSGYQNYLENGFIGSIERSLEDYNTRQNIALFRADPLSIATIMAYVWAKVNEIINIRIILRGKDVNMPAEDIKEALVIV